MTQSQGSIMLLESSLYYPSFLTSLSYNNIDFHAERNTSLNVTVFRLVKLWSPQEGKSRLTCFPGLCLSVIRAEDGDW